MPMVMQHIQLSCKTTKPVYAYIEEASAVTVTDDSSCVLLTRSDDHKLSQIFFSLRDTTNFRLDDSENIYPLEAALTILSHQMF